VDNHKSHNTGSLREKLIGARHWENTAHFDPCHNLIAEVLSFVHFKSNEQKCREVKECTLGPSGTRALKVTF
jgi:hypothetical protein